MDWLDWLLVAGMVIGVLAFIFTPVTRYLEWRDRKRRRSVRWDESTTIEWVEKLVERNEFPQGMTGEQWRVLRQEILATIRTQ